MKEKCKDLATSRWFEFLITGIIILNSVLIGVETYTDNATVKFIQTVILGIFTFEIIVRFIAADSIMSFFKDGWNILIYHSYLSATYLTPSSIMHRQ